MLFAGWRAERGSVSRVPTVARIGPYRFFFFSNEGTEPPHVHVQRERAHAKLWLRPVAVAAVRGFEAPEVNAIEKIVRGNQALFEEAWHEYFEG
jgi:hypothetical protein